MKNQIKLLVPVVCGVVLLFQACQKEESLSLRDGRLKATYTMSNWMGSLDGTYSLSRFSIPGTHDAGAMYEPWPGTAICQSLTIAEQLAAGVRFLDIRCRNYENAFAIHHGSIYQHLNFDDVINTCSAFLTSNPTECIIMSVKEEYTAYNNTLTFEQIFDTYTAKNPDLWYLGATIPILDAVRGKIVLFRRFSASTTPKGLSLNSGWLDNTTFTISNSSGTFRIQDYYSASSTSTKWTYINNMLTEAKSGGSSTMYVNFASGYTTFLWVPSITNVSNYVNPKIVTYFTSNTLGRYGILLMDFADSSKSSLIIATNFN
jgi:1-phosphatidylinositol phosphodiesterase